jgi:hypothetical protein
MSDQVMHKRKVKRFLRNLLIAIFLLLSILYAIKVTFLQNDRTLVMPPSDELNKGEESIQPEN